VSGVTPILKKELREIWRDPYTLGIAVFLPLILLFLFAYALNLDVTGIPMAVLDLDHSRESRRYVDAFTSTGRFKLESRLVSPDQMGELLDRGTVQVALLIPSGFERSLSSGGQAEVQTLIDGTFPTSARVIEGYVAAINDVFSLKLATDRAAGLGLAGGGAVAPAVRLQARLLYNPAQKSANFIVPGLIGVILMAFPPLLSALAIVREKERGSIQQIFISPVKPWAFIVGKLIPYVVIAFGELLLVLLAARFWFRVPLAGDVWLYLLASAPYVISTVAIGLLVSTLVRGQLAAMLLAIVLTLMPAFIFSGFMFSLSTMPPLFQGYSYLFPARYFTTISSGVFLRGVGLEVWWREFLALAAYTFVLVSLAALRFKKKVG